MIKFFEEGERGNQCNAISSQKLYKLLPSVLQDYEGCIHISSVIDTFDKFCK